jgi:hypothetical protein
MNNDFEMDALMAELNELIAEKASSRLHTRS